MTGPREGTIERRERMVSMYKQGLTLQKIGDHFGVTREAIRLHLKKAGITASDGGAHKKSSHRKIKAIKSKEAEYQAKYGMSFAEVKRLRNEGITKMFNTQRHNAGSRGVKWKLTLSEWYSIWVESGKFECRGRGIGSYVMSRINDKGAYELGNVHIQLSTENNSEGIKRLSKRPDGKTGVWHIYPGLAKGWLAKYGYERIGMYATEQDAIDARNAYISERTSQSISNVNPCVFHGFNFFLHP